ncbi:MAG: hypothetical protein AAFO04_29545 [Cyanobacteria bacterium J06592_8]
MSNVICIHVGGAGCSLGAMFWELLCEQHGIEPDGMRRETSSGEAFRTLFSETSSGKNVPQAVFVDSEPPIIDRIRIGAYRRLFHPEQLMTGKENAAGLYARGKYRVGLEYIDQVMDRIRKLTQKCDDLQGFIVMMSVGGGTGSGFGAAILERLTQEYRGLSKMVFAVYPDANSGATPIVAPYNALFALSEVMTYADACVLLDNEKVYDYCRKVANIERPMHSNLNIFMALAMAEILKPLLWGDSPISFSELQANLTSTSGQKFVTPCYEKFISSRHASSHPGSEAVVIPRIWSELLDDFSYHSIPDVPAINDAPTNRKEINRLFGQLQSKFDLLYQNGWYTDWYIREGMDLREFQEQQEKFTGRRGKPLPLGMGMDSGEPKVNS